MRAAAFAEILDIGHMDRLLRRSSATVISASVELERHSAYECSSLRTTLSSLARPQKHTSTGLKNMDAGCG
jgi:hypothetical protein